MDLVTAYRRSVEGWVAAVAAVGDDHWDSPTPCTLWTVRDLVNHVVGEDLWTPPLIQGKTIADVGDSFDGDVLGTDPVGVARDAGDEAIAIVADRLPSGGRVHLSYGDEDMSEYTRQLFADHLIHSWDLAVATGGDDPLDPDLVAELAGWFGDREQLYRQAGIIGPRADVADTGDPQVALLIGFGRDPRWSAHKKSG